MPIRQVFIADRAYYSTVVDMAAASSVVVVGTVIGTSDGPTLGGPAGETGSVLQMGRFTIEVEKALKGASSGAAITFEREAWLTRGGVKSSIAALDGLAPPSLGQRVMLFLVPAPSPEEGVFRLVSLDGQLTIQGDTVRSGLKGDRLAARLAGMKTADVLGQLGG